MTGNADTTTRNPRPAKDIFQGVVRFYTDIVDSEEPRVYQLRVDLLRAYSYAVRELARIERAEQAASRKAKSEKGVKK